MSGDGEHSGLMVVHVVLDSDTGVTILTGGDQEQIQVIAGDYSKE